MVFAVRLLLAFYVLLIFILQLQTGHYKVQRTSLAPELKEEKKSYKTNLENLETRQQGDKTSPPWCNSAHCYASRQFIARPDIHNASQVDL